MVVDPVVDPAAGGNGAIKNFLFNWVAVGCHWLIVTIRLLLLSHIHGEKWLTSYGQL
jgi:hypothetical protein